MQVTIREVAQAAGVSQATAARALSDYGSVSDVARAKVAQAAKELGYETNTIARALRTGTTRAVTFVSGNLSSSFFASIARALSDTLERSGYSLVVSSSYEDVERERAILETMRASMSPGLIVAPAHFSSHEHLKRLRDRGTPVVAVDRSLAADGIDSVTVDNYALGADAARHLVELGHRRIALVIDSSKIFSNLERVRGASDTVAAAGGSVTVVDAGIEVGKAAVTLIAALRSGGERVTALIAMDSDMTEAALFATQEMGLRIPQDLSLLGVDDHALARLLDPPLTVMAQPIEQIGQDAAALMVNRLRSRTPDRVVDIQHRASLILRQSTAALSR